MLLAPWLNPGTFAQQINVSDAVISVPEGVILSTDGGITLQNHGGIANDGTIEVKGDWTNNGRGLLESGRGTVVFSGRDQTIGGENATAFASLVLESEATVELDADITVSGLFVVRDCWVLAHDFAIEILNPGPANYSLGLAHVIRGEGKQPQLASCRLSTASQGSSSLLRHALGSGASAPLGSSPRNRSDRVAGSPAHGYTMSANACLHASMPGKGLVSKQRPSLSNGATAALHTMHHSAGVDNLAVSNDGPGYAGQSTQSHTHGSRGSLDIVPAGATFLFHHVRNGNS